MFSPFFDQESPEVGIKGMIAVYDQSQPYELDAMAVFKAVGKGYLVVRVSGCSCWPDRGGTYQTVCNTKHEVDKACAGWSKLLDACQQANWKVTDKGK
jgi:hypothetical protein